MPTDRNQVCFTTLQFDEPWTYENYLSIGGYQGWEKILNEKMSKMPSKRENYT